jgi:hypothetical protein
MLLQHFDTRNVRRYTTIERLSTNETTTPTIRRSKLKHNSAIGSKGEVKANSYERQTDCKLPSKTDSKDGKTKAYLMRPQKI